MDPKVFKSAIDGIAEAKGISHDAVVEALTEALQRAYIKYLGGGDDAAVEAHIDEENGEITLAQIKNIKKEVEDDYLEISVADAKEDAKETIEHLEEEIKDTKSASVKSDLKALIAKVQEAEKEIKIGGTYPMYCPLEELSKLTAMAVKSNLRLKIAEAERVALYDIYKDHIGEMVTGTVEKADDRSVSVNIGRTSVELTRREMIGDEYFKVGEPIKVYIQEVKQADSDGKPSHGPQIEVTRSSEGFLKRLFEEEIHEIYDGTVLIKGIAREAGVRSKVAVSSNNEDVDPTGACIGPGGSRIQKIVGQLGNGKEKEKIDIIAYSDNAGLYIAESLRPASVLGVSIVDAGAQPHPRAIAVVKDDQLSLAIGKKGANARLANKLTGWSIDIKEESEAQDENIAFVSIEDLQKQAEEEKQVKERAAYAEKSKEEALRAASEEKANEEVKAEPAPAAAEASPLPEAKAETPAAEATPSVAPKADEKPVIVEKKEEAPVQPTIVKTTTTLSDLEKELEESAKNPRPVEHTFKKNDRLTKNRRPRSISDEEVQHVKPSEAVAQDAMPIYSQAELEDIEKEESDNDSQDNSSDDVDIDEYDKYYDDNSGK
ncbi:MAG: transcription termination factor NusA [Bacilli bacterium]|jgi:N utilization substance protein A|nr:transcription termination factor NusA [Bacilli bacterium]MCI2054780.1 transcription termination factor NusA [Bacilli bacterium]